MAKSTPLGALAAQTKYPNSKWQWVYYALAAFDIIAISLSVFFGHTLTQRYKQAVTENEFWNERLGEFSELGKLALSVNAPGNDIFETGDLKRERAQLERATSSFNNSLALARIGIAKTADRNQQKQLNRILDEVEKSLHEVTVDASKVFHSLEEDDRDAAGAYMAMMNRAYSDTVSNIHRLNARTRQFQADKLQHQENQAVQLARFEYVLGGVIAIMVGSVLIYGRKMSKHMIETYRRAERAAIELARNEARHSAIIDSSIDAVVLINSDGEVVEWSRHAEHIFGWKRNEAIGVSFIDAMVPLSSKSQYEDRFSDLLSNKKDSSDGCRFEAEGARKDGLEFPVELSAATITNDGRSWINLFVRDITKRNEAENELTRAKDEAEHALRELSTQKFALDQHAIVAITDAAGTIKYANGKFCAVSKYRKEELIGKNHRILNSGYHPKEFFAEMYRAIHGGNVWQGDIKNKAKDGTFYWVKSTIVPFRNMAGKIERFIAIREDITESKAAEEKIIEAKETAEKANNAKSDFLATMSHEIRTPMNGVIGFANLLMDSPLTPDQNNYARTIKNSGEALLSIINDILDFSKIEAGKMEIENMPFDLREATEEAVELLSSRAHDRKIDLLLRFDSDVPQGIVADPGRVRQIIVNLVGNAIKFTEKGHVLIDVKREPGREKELIRISVTDTGIGIPEDKQQLLFNKFTQADSSTARKFGGTGLGLAISKLLSELMGGVIGLDSEEGKGSTFWFTLPIPQTEVALPEKEIEPDIQNHSVLVIDDYPTNRNLLAELLAQWGARFELAASPTEGLEKMKAAAARGTPFEAAILDHSFPEMDSETLGSKILEDEDLKVTKLIILTSDSNPGDNRHLLEIGFSEFLPKPLIRSNSLRRAIARCVGTSTTNTEPTPTQRAQSEPHPTETPPDGAYRLLVVDDNQTNQLLLKQLILTKYGYSVDLAANGKEAVEMVKQLPYDLVFMDCMMPEMDGFEATAAIRSIETNSKTQSYPGIDPKRRIPILALTANAMTGDRENCIQAGMDDYLSKPIKPARLASAISEWLGNQSPVNEKEITDPDTKSESDLPIFNPQILLEFFPDDPETTSQMLETFLEGIKEQIVELKAALHDSKNIDDIRFHAHRIKGSAEEFGANQLGNLADKIEEACRKNRLQTALDFKDEILDSAEKTIAAVESYDP